MRDSLQSGLIHDHEPLVAVPVHIRYLPPTQQYLRSLRDAEYN